MEDGLLERVNFDLAALNAYLQSRGKQEGDSALHVASQEGHVEVAYWLLMEGADCRAVNQFGDTPLCAPAAAAAACTAPCGQSGPGRP